MSLNDWASPFPADNAPSGNLNAVNNKRREKIRNSTIKKKIHRPETDRVHDEVTRHSERRR